MAKVERKTQKLGAGIISEALVFGFIAMVLRAIYAGLIIARYGRNQFSDFLYMHQITQSLARGEGFTLCGQWVFNQSVGYPAFMSIFYRLITPEVPVAIIINIFLGALSVALLYIFSRLLFRGYSYKQSSFGIDGAIARCAAVLAIIYPDSLLYCPFFASENLLIPLLLLLLIAVIIDFKKDWLSGIIVGGLAASAASVKAYIIFLFIFIPLIWWVRNRRFFAKTCFAIFSAVIILLPWTYANYKASGGKIIPFSAVMGTAFLDGTNPKAVGKPTNFYWLPEEVERGHNEVERNQMRMEKAVSYIKENPLWYGKLLIKKLLYSFSPARDFIFQNSGQQRLFSAFLSRWLPTAFNALLLAGVLIGLVISARKRSIFVLGMSIFVSSLVLQLLLFAYPRYRFTFLFCLLPFAALGLIFLADSCRSGAQVLFKHHGRVNFLNYYDSSFANILFRWLDRQKIIMIENIIRSISPKIIVDLGCGGGNIASRLSRRTICLDNNFGLLKVCVKKKLIACVTDMEGNLPIASSSCDLLIMADVIEHISNRETLLKESFRIIKPGGIAIIFTPPYDSVRWTIAQKIHFLLLRTPADHISPYTEESLRYCLGKHFKTLEIHRLNFNLTMCAIARK